MGITICIATYNGEQFIKEQLDSILIQLSENDEIIVSDDCSDDHTLDIIKAYHDPRIKIYQGKRFGSPIFNFENALKNATGDIIFLSDQDDVWEADKVNILVNALKQYDLVFSNARIVDREGRFTENLFFKKKPPLGVFQNIVSNHYFGATMAFKRKVLDKALPFPPNIPMHDEWLGIIARHYFLTGYVDVPLIRYRRHGNNASFCGEKSQNSLYRKLMFRISMIKSFVCRIL